MTTPSPIEQERAPKAVITNGEGNHCTSHLNLTVTLADPPVRRVRLREYERDTKIPYAGKDHHV
jgi:hypothetical protein